MVLKEAHFPIQTLQMLQQERKKKKECFEWKKHYPSPNKFYLILFSNIQQYQQTVYLKLSVSEVLVLEQLHLSGNI